MLTKAVSIVILMDYCEEVLIDQQLSLLAKPDLASATNTAENSTLAGDKIVQLSDYRK